MFSLIITNISIALVAALAVATIYYGGSAFSSGSAKANAATIIAAAQQVTGANTLYANDNSGAYATTLAALTPTYLSSVPQPPVGAASTYAVSNANLFTADVLTAQVCLQIDESNGLVPVGTTTTTSIPTSASTTAQYSCYSSTGTGTGGTTSYKFQYAGG